MASRGRGRRGRPRGASQAPPVFDQQAFVEAVRVQLLPLHRLVQLEVREVRVTSKGLSHIILQRSQGGGDPMMADHWSDRLRRYWRLWRLSPTL